MTDKLSDGQRILALMIGVALTFADYKLFSEVIKVLTSPLAEQTALNILLALIGIPIGAFFALIVFVCLIAVVVGR